MRQMSPSSSRWITPKVLALVVILIASRLAPATAVLDFCATMPCCAGQTEVGPTMAADMPDCGIAISSYEAPSRDLAVPAKAKTHIFVAITPAILTVQVAVTPVSATRRTSDDPSPATTTSERLSALSTFLI